MPNNRLASPQIQEHHTDPLVLLKEADSAVPRSTEDRILPAGYADLLHRDWLFNNKLRNARTPEAAVFLNLEQKFLDVPPELQWENLKTTVPNKTEDPKFNQTTHKRMEAIWKQLLVQRSKLFSTKRTLEHHWTHTPLWLSDKEAQKFMKETPIEIMGKYQRAVRAIISTPDDSANKDIEYHSLGEENSRSISKLEAWQTTEKELRWGIFRQQKLYVITLRLYYEMLLENTEKKVEEKRKKEREKTARRNERKDELREILAKVVKKRSSILEALRKITEAKLLLEDKEGLMESLNAKEAKATEDLKTAEKLIEEAENTLNTFIKNLPEEKEKQLRADLAQAQNQKAEAAAQNALEKFLKDQTIEDPQYVLPKNHPKREEVATRNKHLRLIDARNQAIAVGKAAHHQQKKKRVRKTEQVPYLFHALDVADAMVMDIVPFDIHKETRKAINVVLIGIIGPLHDIIEDTELDIDDLIDDFLKRIIDMYDSSLDPVIKSAFETDRQDLKVKILDLLKTDIKVRARKILRILSNNTDLTQEEKQTALKQNIAGIPGTVRALNFSKNKEKITNSELTEDERSIYAGFHEKAGKEHDKKVEVGNPAKTFSKFPEDYDDYKLTTALIRLNVIGDAKDRQLALITKMEDRANNILTIDDFEVEKQQSTLRSTVTRLISWAVNDHDRKNYPLYNALPRLIDNTLDAYYKFRHQNPGKMASIDNRCIVELINWQKECRSMQDEIPYEYALNRAEQEVLKTYEEGRNPGEIPYYLKQAMIVDSSNLKPAVREQTQRKYNSPPPTDSPRHHDKPPRSQR